jgi:hypothetical protein
MGINGGELNKTSIHAVVSNDTPARRSPINSPYRTSGESVHPRKNRVQNEPGLNGRKNEIQQPGKMSNTMAPNMPKIFMKRAPLILKWV